MLVTVNSPKTRWRRIAVGIVVVAAGTIAVLLLTGGGSKEIPGANGKPAATSPAQLEDLARSLGHPIYWLGPRADKTIEATHNDPDNTYVRYLGAGVKVGDPHPDFTTVGTYLRGSALHGLRSVAAQPGHRSFRLPGGGLVVAGDASKSVYLAYPGSDYQVEVYAPGPGEALRLARAGQVKPLG